MTNILFKNLPDMDDEIGAIQHHCDWFLLFQCVLVENRKVMLVHCKQARREASIPTRQFLEHTFGVDMALRLGWTRVGELFA